jgi:hypothetical protein
LRTPVWSFARQGLNKADGFVDIQGEKKEREETTKKKRRRRKKLSTFLEGYK